MADGLRLKYYGWSGFRLITPEGRRLFFDPLLTDPLSGAPLVQRDGLEAGDLVCVTHGHFDHYMDVSALVEGRDVLVIGSDEICDFTRRTHGVPPAKLRPIPFDATVAVEGIRLHTFEWDHRIVDPKAMFAQTSAPTFEQLRTIYFATPHAARRMGFVVELADGRKVVNYCEGFNDQTQMDKVAAVAARHRPDVLIGGAQLDYDGFTAEAIATLKPRVAVLFHPHRAYFDLIGLRSKPIEAFLARIAEECPGVEARVPEAFEEITL